MSKVIVETELGKIRGVEKVSCLGDPYLAFYGLRYAEAPVGDRRFKVQQVSILLLLEFFFFVSCHCGKRKK